MKCGNESKSTQVTTFLPRLMTLRLSEATLSVNDERSFRAWLESEWVRIDREAKDGKDSYGAIFGLANLYRSIPAERLDDANEVIVGWALSERPEKRFDGLVLIDQFAIIAAIPHLELLAERLKDGDDVSSTFDRAKVIRIIGRLSRRRPSSS